MRSDLPLAIPVVSHSPL